MTVDAFGIVVTRPGAAGSALVAGLVERGAAAVAAPAFTLGAPPDEAAAAEALGRLADFDLVVFVSPAAVRAVVARMTTPWPAQTAIAAVGAATAQAIEHELHGARHARRIVPAGDAEAGSEVLWDELQRVGMSGAARRVLLLRAQSGRDWLADRFADAGAQVDSVAVYSRTPASPDTLAVAAMRTWHEGGRRAALVVTSSEAVDVVAARWAAQMELATSGLRSWWRAGVLIVPHGRIAGRARDAGFADVRLAEATADAVVAALASPP